MRITCLYALQDMSYVNTARALTAALGRGPLQAAPLLWATAVTPLPMNCAALGLR
jgi:hypothetical protein